MIRKQLNYLLVLILFSQLIYAQTELEVVTKTIEKSIPFKPKGTIMITGENSTITIDHWEKEEVRIKLKLITKHRIKSVAVAELESIKYLIEKKDHTIYLRNYFLEKTASAEGCILKVEYELMLPKECNIQIKNSLGNIELKNGEGKIDIEAKFGNINLIAVRGNVTVDLKLGDIQASELNGINRFKASNATVNMDNLYGSYYLTLSNSDLIFKPVNTIDLLNVTANNGNVNVHLSNSDSYNYTFNTTYGEIKVPDNLRSMLLQKKNASSFVNYKNKSHPVLSVKSNFGNVLLTTNLNLK
jgi:DUF4097 and DUF4098 domain-containing protein YvlB